MTAPLLQPKKKSTRDRHRLVFSAICPVHGWVQHGREAEELRAGIEKILDAEPELDAITSDARAEKMIDWLQDSLRKLLDDVDARDSLVFGDARDALDLEVDEYLEVRHSEKLSELLPQIQERVRRRANKVDEKGPGLVAMPLTTAETDRALLLDLVTALLTKKARE